MTTTTGPSGRTRTATPWPARHEREGRTGRHAVAEPDVTDRLPVVPRGSFPARTALPAAPRPMPLPERARPVVPAPRPAPAAPVYPVQQTVPQQTVPQRPVPPRPVVGSGIGTALPAPAPHNGLGTTALCLGLIALPLGLVPVTGFVAAGFGLIALVFGLAGRSRVRAGVATNRAGSVTGAVLGLLALLLGAVATVAFFRTPDQLVYTLDTFRTLFGPA